MTDQSIFRVVFVAELYSKQIVIFFFIYL